MSYDPQNDYSERQNNHMMGMNQNQNSYQNPGPQSPMPRSSMSRVNDPQYNNQNNNNNYNYNNQYNNNSNNNQYNNNGNSYNDMGPTNNITNNNQYGNNYNTSSYNNDNMGQNSYGTHNQEIYNTDRKSVVSSSRMSSLSGSQSEVGQNKLKKPSELKTQTLRIKGLKILQNNFSTKIHYGKKQFAYEFSTETGDLQTQRLSKRKIEIQFADIVDIKVQTKENIITVFTQTMPKQLQQVEVNGKMTWEQTQFVQNLQTLNGQIIDFIPGEIFEFESTYTRNQLTKNGSTRTSHLDKIRETRLPLNVDGNQESPPRYRYNNNMPQNQGQGQNYPPNQGGNVYRGSNQRQGSNGSYNNNQQPPYMGGNSAQIGDENFQNNNNRGPQGQYANQRGPPPNYQRNSSFNSQDQWDYHSQQGANQRPPSQGYGGQNYNRNEPAQGEFPPQNYKGNQNQQYNPRDPQQQPQRDPQYMQQRGPPPPHQQQSHQSQQGSGGPQQQFSGRNNQNSSQELNYNNEMGNRVANHPPPPRNMPQNQPQNIIPQQSRPNSISNMNTNENRGANMGINNQQNQMRSHSSNSLNQSGHIQNPQRENIAPVPGAGPNMPGPVGNRTPQHSSSQNPPPRINQNSSNNSAQNGNQNGQYYQQSQFGRQSSSQQGGPNFQNNAQIPPQQRGQPPMQNMPPNKNNANMNRFPPGQQGNINNMPPQQGAVNVRISGVNQMMYNNQPGANEYNQNINQNNMRPGPQQFGNQQQQQQQQNKQIVIGKKTKKAKLQEEKLNLEMNRNSQLPIGNQIQGPMGKGANQNNMAQPINQPAPPKKQKDNDKLFQVEINENRIKQLLQFNSQIVKTPVEERLKEIIQKNNLDPLNNKTQNNKCPYSKCQKQFKTISQFQQHFKKKHYELNELLYIDEDGYVKVNEKGFNFAQMISELFPKFNEHSLDIMRKQLKQESNQDEKPTKKNKQDRNSSNINIVNPNPNVSVNSTSVSLQNFNN